MQNIPPAMSSTQRLPRSLSPDWTPLQTCTNQALSSPVPARAVELEGFIEEPFASRAPHVSGLFVALSTVDDAEGGNLVVHKGANRLGLFYAFPVELQPGGASSSGWPI